jgi:hypothetical protein
VLCRKSHVWLLEYLAIPMGTAVSLSQLVCFEELWKTEMDFFVLWLCFCATFVLFVVRVLIFRLVGYKSHGCCDGEPYKHGSDSCCYDPAAQKYYVKKESHFCSCIKPGCNPNV